MFGAEAGGVFKPPWFIDEPVKAALHQVVGSKRREGSRGEKDRDGGKEGGRGGMRGQVSLSSDCLVLADSVDTLTSSAPVTAHHDHSRQTTGVTGVVASDGSLSLPQYDDDLRAKQ
ncbi:hypothetical protein PAMP_006207 [Pampus punctatissimus]